jgi:hypothetical protein
MREYFKERYFEGTPIDVEVAIASEWETRSLVGYLNCQAFCYHIGAAGKEGPGGYLEVGDKAYEAAWRNKQL